jgi:hypothetical protein
MPYMLKFAPADPLLKSIEVSDLIPVCNPLAAEKLPVILYWSTLLEFSACAGYKIHRSKNNIPLITYAILMIAVLLSPTGHTIVKFPAVEVLSAPKSSTITVFLPEAVKLYTIIPRAVTVDVDHVVSVKSIHAVVLVEVGA